ncbi:hypothetical protein AURDEDRAFT_172674 [Auricularia subglabra TFB-10046 SS5]|nr:hypothetical protein AURDEDRAFT_172674 [Auricularia subglabra TFB-10046 SS5]
MNADVVSVILDNIDLPTLLASSHVSRLWRDCARSHPTFWKRLSIDDITSLTPGAVQLFLDRLGSRHPTDFNATIYLSMRCTVPTSAIITRVFPAVQQHLPRVEQLAFIISPALVPAVWPLFELNAPRLKSLQVIMDRPCPQPDPVPALFNAHKHNALENVFLLDVPLSACAQPVGHVLKGVKAVYSDESYLLARVVSWLPLSQTHDLQLCRGRRNDLDLRDFPALDASQLQALRHLVINHAETLLGLPKWHIPIMTIRLHELSPGQVREILPTGGPLGVCFRRRIHPLYTSLFGEVTVTSLNGHTIRHFVPVALSRMCSPAFLWDVVLSDRVCVLASPLFCAFYTLCEHRYHLPQLTTLRIALNELPDHLPCWNIGAIHCPRLHTLILQRESDHQDAIVSQTALESFIENAFTGNAGTRLNVVLEGIRLEGAGTLPATVSVFQRLPKLSWSQPAHSDDPYASINKIPWVFGQPRLDWLSL